MLCLLITVVFASVIQAIPTVRAQYGLYIVTTGQPVGSVPTGTNVHLTFSVSWSNLNIGWYLIVGLEDIPTSQVMSSATATGSPIACYHLSTGGRTPGGCVFQVEQTSGIETMAFDFPAPSTPQTLHLNAAGYVSSSSDLKPIVVANVSSEISILVANQAQSTTYPTNSWVTYTPATFGSTSTTPFLQMPQSPQSSTASQPTGNPIQSNPLVAPVIAVIAAVALVALILYNTRGKKPEITTAEKIDSKTKKAASGKNFCIECGSELPAKSKFCNNCGTKQP
jgi:hypothetical protein